MNYAAFPLLNATLNGACAVLLACGFCAIKLNRVSLHRLFMGSAFLVSTVFLIFYLIYHAHAGSKPYTGTGTLRTVYFTILISHTILATVIVPFILRVLFLALKQRFEDHRRLARWVLPVWFYVSVTGVVIYKMLY